jgi:hypothetical protein
MGIIVVIFTTIKNRLLIKGQTYDIYPRRQQKFSALIVAVVIIMKREVMLYVIRKRQGNDESSN